MKTTSRHRAVLHDTLQLQKKTALCAPFSMCVYPHSCSDLILDSPYQLHRLREFLWSNKGRTYSRCISSALCCAGIAVDANRGVTYGAICVPFDSSAAAYVGVLVVAPSQAYCPWPLLYQQLHFSYTRTVLHGGFSLGYPLQCCTVPELYWNLFSLLPISPFATRTTCGPTSLTSTLQEHPRRHSIKYLLVHFCKVCLVESGKVQNGPP